MKMLNIKKSRANLPLLALILSLVSIFFIFSNLHAQSSDFNLVTGVDTSAKVAGFATGGQAESVNSIIGMVIYIFLGLVGVLFLGLTIFSGIKWMIAQGNEERVRKAKDSLLNSIIGLAIALSAYAISYFLINYFT